MEISSFTVKGYGKRKPLSQVCAQREGEKQICVGLWDKEHNHAGLYLTHEEAKTLDEQLSKALEGTPVPSLPWFQSKLAFELSPEADKVIWDKWKEGLGLPKGWDLAATDISGASGHIAIFDVEGMPSIEDGEKVKAILEGLGK
ncbi:MAG: hypothetical protein V3V74_07345 [Nitrosomonadaceae bacterium]